MQRAAGDSFPHLKREALARRDPHPPHRLQVRVGERLGSLALAADDQLLEELGKSQRCNQLLGVGPRGVGNRSAAQACCRDPLAEAREAGERGGGGQGEAGEGRRGEGGGEGEMRGGNLVEDKGCWRLLQQPPHAATHGQIWEGQREGLWRTRGDC